MSFLILDVKGSSKNHNDQTPLLIAAIDINVFLIVCLVFYCARFFNHVSKRGVAQTKTTHDLGKALHNFPIQALHSKYSSPIFSAATAL